MWLLAGNRPPWDSARDQPEGPSCSESDRLSQRVPVQSRRLDTMIGEQHPQRRIDSIVFKIDIEGFEGVGMLGFTCLDAIPERLGILELEPQYVATSPAHGASALEPLLGYVIVLDSKLGVRHLRRIASMDDLLRLQTSDGRKLHSDLIVASPLTLLTLSWRVH